MLCSSSSLCLGLVRSSIMVSPRVAHLLFHYKEMPGVSKEQTRYNIASRIRLYRIEIIY